MGRGMSRWDDAFELFWLVLLLNDLQHTINHIFRFLHTVLIRDHYWQQLPGAECDSAPILWPVSLYDIIFQNAISENYIFTRSAIFPWAIFISIHAVNRIRYKESCYHCPNHGKTIANITTATNFYKMALNAAPHHFASLLNRSPIISPRAVC